MADDLDPQAEAARSPLDEWNELVNDRTTDQIPPDDDGSMPPDDGSRLNEGWEPPLDEGASADYEPINTPGEPTRGTSGDSWMPQDLGDLIDRIERGEVTVEPPTIGLIEGDDKDRGLFYRGKSHGIAGASGSGKTYVALAVGVGHMLAGGALVLVDLEDTPETALLRLIVDLGADPDLVRERFRYVRPREKSPAGFERLCAIVAASPDPLVVLDSTGEALAMEGAKSNADEDVASWFATIVDPLLVAGATVVLLDHTVKDPEGGLWPTGSQRKRARLTGVQYIAITVKPFSREKDGFTRLVCAKDRGGNYAHNERVAEAHFEQVDGWLSVALRRPVVSFTEGGTFRPTSLMGKVSEFVEANPGASKNAIEKGVTGNRDAIRTAREVLVAEGWLDESETTRGFEYRSLLAYRQAADPRSDQYEGGTSDRTGGAS